MRIVRDVLSLSLAASGFIGVRLLLSDAWLWSAAPTHAYGLIGFALVDLILAGISLKRFSLAAFGAAFMSTSQFGAMLADLVAGAPVGIPAVVFRNYLLSDTSYLVLLFIQIVIAFTAAQTLAISFFHKGGRLSAILRFSHR